MTLVVISTSNIPLLMIFLKWDYKAMRWLLIPLMKSCVNAKSSLWVIDENWANLVDRQSHGMVIGTF